MVKQWFATCFDQGSIPASDNFNHFYYQIQPQIQINQSDYNPKPNQLFNLYHDLYQQLNPNQLLLNRTINSLIQSNAAESNYY